MRTFLICVAFHPSSYATYEARSVACVSTRDGGRTEQLARIWVIDFADVESLDKEYSMEDAGAAAMFVSGNLF